MRPCERIAEGLAVAVQRAMSKKPRTQNNLQEKRTLNVPPVNCKVHVYLCAFMHVQSIHTYVWMRVRTCTAKTSLRRYMGHIPIVPHKAAAEVSRVGNLREELVC